MKPNNSTRTALLATMGIAALIAVACGLPSSKNRENKNKFVSAQENTIQSNGLNKTMPEEKALTNTKNAQPALTSQADVPPAQAGAVDERDPFQTGMPYYCDPVRYPPNIINNIAACKPFLGHLPPAYGVGYGAGYGTGYIGYKMRGDLGNRWYGRNDDDDDGRRGSWRNRGNRHQHNGSKRYQGSKRPGRP